VPKFRNITEHLTIAKVHFLLKLMILKLMIHLQGNCKKIIKMISGRINNFKTCLPKNIDKISARKLCPLLAICFTVFLVHGILPFYL